MCFTEPIFKILAMVVMLFAWVARNSPLVGGFSPIMECEVGFDDVVVGVEGVAVVLVGIEGIRGVVPMKSGKGPSP